METIQWNEIKETYETVKVNIKKSKNRIFTVSIGSRSTNVKFDVNLFDEIEYRHYSKSEIRDLIIDKAIIKMWGKNCFWFADNGLGWDYGQVFEALRSTRNDSNPGSTSRTNRVRIDIYYKSGKRAF
jgi:hypothetical protein